MRSVEVAVDHALQPPRAMRVADWIAEQLLTLGVSHVYGVGGAHIEDVCAAVQRRRPRLRLTMARPTDRVGMGGEAASNGGIILPSHTSLH